MRKPKTFGVIGGRGFIGTALCHHAEAAGFSVRVHSHDEVLKGVHFDVLVYCSGIAWGAQSRPIEAFEAHVSAVARLLSSVKSGRFVYLSSTRVYDDLETTAEHDRLTIDGEGVVDVYRTSKLAGEWLTLAGHHDPIVVRLSNVYGPSFQSGLFLSDVLRQAVDTATVRMYTLPESEKDYVSVDDVGDAIVRLCSGEHVEKIYNVASGVNTTNAQLVQVLKAAGISVEIAANATLNVAKPISVERLCRTIDWRPRNVLNDLPALIEMFRTNLKTNL